MSQASPLFVIVAAEPSGDLLAGHIIQALRERHPNARFVGMTGPHMLAAGCESLFSIDEISVMMFTEILGKIVKILKIKKQIIQYCLQEKPDAFIGVDAPEFNLAIERKLKKSAIKTIHYNSPKIWAWRPKRINKIAQSCSLILTQFPFEKELYDAKNIPAVYVGHPLADQIDLHSDQNAAKTICGLNQQQPILALLPGSRGQELALLLKPFLLAAEQLHQSIPGGIQCVIPLNNEKRFKQYQQIRATISLSVPIHTLQGQAQTAMIASDAILVAAGTATLEAMLIKRPMIVAYRVKWFTYQLVKLMAKIDFISLPNIIARQAMVAEYLQDAVQPELLAQALLPYLSNPDQPFKHHARFTALHEHLRMDAARKTAEAISDIL